ncbi:hypothetical protein G5I_03494 [Acromyrmex echinatior]|uniref:Uncharacterized protein n=1 Tax=Acromyrmex echinatior TaxID=103372 RepID=F4WD44_ACREC|nr:hypothetical protein G5I_03494 [Acromyrmex echinatior]
MEKLHFLGHCPPVMLSSSCTVVWSVSKAAGHSSECCELDFAKLSNLSCSQSSGPRYLSLKCPPSGNDRKAASRFTNTTYWRKQPRDSPKGRRALDYLPEEGTRSSIPSNGFILENFCKFVPLESLKRIL